MSIIQIARVGTKYVVQEDGVTVAGLSFDHRSKAVAAAVKYKENL